MRWFFRCIPFTDRMLTSLYILLTLNSPWSMFSNNVVHGLLNTFPKVQLPETAHFYIGSWWMSWSLIQQQVSLQPGSMSVSRAMIALHFGKPHEPDHTWTLPIPAPSGMDPQKQAPLLESGVLGLPHTSWIFPYSLLLSPWPLSEDKKGEPSVDFGKDRAFLHTVTPKNTWEQESLVSLKSLIFCVIPAIKSLLIPPLPKRWDPSGRGP